jgi:hypothetical protein
VQTANTALSGTFNVTAAGVYYLVIGAVSSSTEATQAYLAWDDLSVTIPCYLNSPTVTAMASADTICPGDQVFFTASGANIYTWNTSATTNSTVVTPTTNGTYQVVGTSTLNGCSNTVSMNIYVHDPPNVLIAPSSTAICKGTSAVLYGGGAVSYSWSTGIQASTVQVSPTVPTSYTVSGTDLNGCVGSAVQSITIIPPTTLSVVCSATRACIGDRINISVSGASSYSWNSGLFQGPNVSVVLTGPITLTVTGTDANGCSDEQKVTLALLGCTGLKEERAGEDLIRVYPNPGKDFFTVSFADHDQRTLVVTDMLGKIILRREEERRTLVVTDMLGKIILRREEESETSQLDFSALPAGIYQLYVISGTKTAHEKIVKE